jgi:predicted nucleotide-binding protein
MDKFLDENLPGARAMLDKKLHHGVFFRGGSESDYDVFMREDGEPSLAFIDSLQLDIKNDEYDFSREEQPHQNTSQTRKTRQATPEHSTRVFIVHGHDEALKIKAARFVEKLGFKAIILHEQANQGHTIIEKIEAHTEVGFAIVLYTPDDAGGTEADAKAGTLKPRARQNVVFEHGYLIAKLSRARVVPLVAGKVELPSDISGVVYVDDTNWQIDIAKEMKAAGYNIDFNKLVDS